MSLGQENSSTIEAWQAEFLPPATCKHCHRSDNIELHEYDGLQGLWCEDCADMHINNEEERLSVCCGAPHHFLLDELCSQCKEWADFECTECGE